MQNGDYKEKRTPIKRVKHGEPSSVPLEDIEMKTHSGEKTPTMPESFAKREILPLKVLCKHVLIKERCEVDDIRFIKDSVTLPEVPDYSGYNRRERRNQGMTKNPKTNVCYKLLINKSRIDLSTILTAVRCRCAMSKRLRKMLDRTLHSLLVINN